MVKRILKNIIIAVFVTDMMLTTVFGLVGPETFVVEAKADETTDPIEENYSGVYIGKITAVNDGLGESLTGDRTPIEWIVELDGKQYNTTTQSTVSTLSKNSIWSKCRDIGTENENKSSTVVCLFKDGKISKLASISDVVSTTVKYNIDGSINYCNYAYNGIANVTLSVTTDIKTFSPFSYNDLTSAKGKNKVNIELSYSKGDDGLLEFENNADADKGFHSSMGFKDTVTTSLALKGNKNIVPSKINNKSSFLYRLTLESYADKYGEISVPVGNMDLQKNKEKKSTELNQASANAIISLQNNTAVTLDSNIDQYINPTQKKEIEEFLTIWLAEIIESQSFEPEDGTEKFAQDVMQKVLKKMNISLETFFYLRTSAAEVEVKAESKEYGNININFKITLQSYSMSASSKPYASFGNLEYTVEGKDVKGVTTGVGTVTYANVSTFTDQVKSIADSAIKGAYNSVWGKNANKVAGMFISEPVMQLLGGDFSGKVYKLLSKPTDDYIKNIKTYKKISIKCPVDVYVYDWDGNCVGEIINNEVNTDYDNIFMYANGDQKFIYLTDSEYVIKLVGNGDGSMEYEVETFQNDIPINKQVTGVRINKNKVFYALSPTLSTDSDVLSLCNEDGDDRTPNISIDNPYDDKDFIFEIINDSYAKLVKYTGSDENVVIPSSIESDGKFYDVKEIGDKAFYQESYYYYYSYSLAKVVSITIPKTIKLIGKEAFEECRNLKNVEIEGSVTLGDEVFHQCTSLENILFDNNVAKIGTYVFAGCSNLKNINLPLIGESLSNYAFCDCKSLKKVILNEGVKEIGEGAFYSCESLEDVKLPESLTKISEVAFYSCNALSEIKLPGNISYIGNYAFKECVGLKKINIPDSITDMGVKVFYGCEGLKSLSLGDGLTTIPSETFNGSYLEEIKLSAKTEVLGYGAFEGCSYLKTINIPKDIKKIDIYAFAGCKNLKHLDWPEKITTIGYGMFSGSGLEEFEVPDTVTTIESAVFTNCVNLKRLKIGNNVTIIGSTTKASEDHSVMNNIGNFDGTYILQGCSNLETLEIGKGINRIEKMGFHISDDSYYRGAELYSLKKVILSDNIDYIVEDAFNGCEQLKDINIPEGVKGIGPRAFYNCKSLEKIVLPETLEDEIDPSTFEKCSGLKSISIPSSIKKIGDSAFKECSSLTELVIPKNVILMPPTAIAGCSNLNKITFYGDTKIDGDDLWQDNKSAYANVTIYGYSGTKLEEFAKKESIKFVSLGNMPGDNNSSENTPGNNNGNSSENTSGNTSGNNSGSTSGDISSNTSGNTSGSTNGNTSGINGGNTAGNTSNGSNNNGSSTNSTPSDTGNTSGNSNTGGSTSSNTSGTTQDDTSASNTNDNQDDSSDISSESDSSQLISSIKRKKGKITKLTSKKNRITVKFKRITISGKTVKYQIAIKQSTAKNWKKSYLSSTKKTFKKLKKGKIYWISVRPYITIDGTKYFGKWSKTLVKKVK